MLDDIELDELDQFLRAHAGEESLLLDGVHGLLTANAIGPQPAGPEEWLPEILNEPFADAEQGKRVLELLARLNESVCSKSKRTNTNRSSAKSNSTTATQR